MAVWADDLICLFALENVLKRAFSDNIKKAPTKLDRILLESVFKLRRGYVFYRNGTHRRSFGLH